MENTVSVWWITEVVQLSKSFQGPGGPCRGLPQEDNYSNNSDAYGSPTKWTVTIEKKRGCIEIVFTCTETEEYYISKDVQTVYLRD